MGNGQGEHVVRTHCSMDAVEMPREPSLSSQVQATSTLARLNKCSQHFTPVTEMPCLLSAHWSTVLATTGSSLWVSAVFPLPLSGGPSLPLGQPRSHPTSPAHIGPGLFNMPQQCAVFLREEWMVGDSSSRISPPRVDNYVLFELFSF